MGRKPKRTATQREGEPARPSGPRQDRGATSPYGRGEAVLFSLTLFLSAALLFIVDPMFAKMVLPQLGGAPVWNACLVFYQAALLAGYLYAHLSLKWLGPRWQAVLHPGLLGLAAIVPADPRCPRLAAAGHDVPGPVALDTASGFPGPAVSRRLGQRADAPGLVRPGRTPPPQSPPDEILTSSTRPATSAACWPCWPIR